MQLGQQLRENHSNLTDELHRFLKSTMLEAIFGGAPFHPKNLTMEHLMSTPLHTDGIVDISTTLLLITIAVIGILGNGLVIWAFCERIKRGTVSHALIVSLASLDLLVCCVGIPSTLYFDIWRGHAVDWACRLHMTFKGFIIPVSAALLVLIATERFLLICFIPGICIKWAHLQISVVLIILSGTLLAIPMGLHGRAIRVAKSKDELLDPAISSEAFNYAEQLKQSNKFIPMRCDKDDTYISDAHYWYYQLVVMLFFASLFIALFVIYSTIFAFVWRHESLMFKRYGRSKYLGEWVRIPISNGCQQQATASGRRLKKASSEKSRCACLCDSIKEERRPSGSHLNDSTPDTGLNTANAADIFSEPQLSTTSEKEDIELLAKNYKSVNFPGERCSEDGIQSLEHERNMTSNASELIESRKDAPTQSSEGHRRPHVRTAQTFALIAAAFMFSYTPYLVYTCKPTSNKSPLMYASSDIWYNRLGRILFYLYFVNSAANPIIYSCWNRHFQVRLQLLYRNIRSHILCIKEPEQSNKEVEITLQRTVRKSPILSEPMMSILAVGENATV